MSCIFYEEFKNLSNSKRIKKFKDLNILEIGVYYMSNILKDTNIKFAKEIEINGEIKKYYENVD